MHSPLSSRRRSHPRAIRLSLQRPPSCPQVVAPLPSSAPPHESPRPRANTLQVAIAIVLVLTLKNPVDLTGNDGCHPDKLRPTNLARRHEVDARATYSDAPPHAYFEIRR